ncbi:MAG: hypothetical protein WDW36_002407 [Sanguina aurantia]
MPDDEFTLGQGGHRDHHRLGQRRQATRRGRRVHPVVVEGEAEPKRGGGLELVKALKLGLRFALIEGAQHAGDFSSDVGALERQLVDPRVEHVVQQQGLCNDAFGQEGAVGKHLHQALARAGLLFQ